jgi:hypothetical protein
MRQSFTYQDLSENRRKNLKMQKESAFVWFTALAAILPVESKNCMQSSAGCKLAIQLGEQQLNLKMKATFKIFLPIANPILTKACPTISLSAQSNLVRLYL